MPATFNRTFFVCCAHGRAQDKNFRLRSEREAVVASGVRVELVFPELTESATGLDVAQGQDVLGTGLSPEHAGLFAAQADDGLAAGFDDTGTDEEPLVSEGALLPTGPIFPK